MTIKNSWCLPFKINNSELKKTLLMPICHAWTCQVEGQAGRRWSDPKREHRQLSMMMDEGAAWPKVGANGTRGTLQQRSKRHQ